MGTNTNIAAEAPEDAKVAWSAPTLKEVQIAEGTQFACSPCPDSGCFTARAS